MVKLKFKHKIAVFLILLVAKTWRIKIYGTPPNSNAIVLFWHGKMLPGWYIFRKHNPIGVVSPSKDGEILSYLLKSWNYSLLRGSSSTNSKLLLKEITEKAMDHLIVMTPDGPKGPIYKMKAGAVVAAQRSGTPIILCGIHTNSYKLFYKSWDRFIFPYPFAKIRINLSGPKMIPADMDREGINSMIEELERELNCYL